MDSKSILLVGYSLAKWAGWEAQIKAMGTRYLGPHPARPVKQNQAISQASPKPKALWNRLLSVWKRMEAFGNDSKRLMGLGQIGFLIEYWGIEMRIFWDAEICELCVSLKANPGKNNKIFVSKFRNFTYLCGI